MRPDPTRPEPTLTAVTVTVPSALDAIGAHRHLDRAAGWGVPPHVTIAYPFAPPGQLDDAMVDRLATVVASVAAFDTAFVGTAWFGDEVLYLAPEPDTGFRSLTAAVWDAFPDWPPYGGEFADPVPHLTIGHAPLATPDQLRGAERDITARLPLSTRVDRVDLLAGTDAPDSWRTMRELPLR